MPKFEVVPILELVRGTPTTMTSRFRGDFGGQPGQFLMVWIPRYDELPMAISYLGAVKGITVHDYGDATHAFATFSAGDRIGVRGPYGNAFRLEGEKVLAVGGGSGIGSMIAAIEAVAEQGAPGVTPVAAETASEPLLVERGDSAEQGPINTDHRTP